MKDLTAGTAGGCMGIVVGQPLDTAKVRLQSHPEMYRNFWHVLVSMFRNEGVRRRVRWLVCVRTCAYALCVHVLLLRPWRG